jgi:hypothetical protein
VIVGGMEFDGTDVVAPTLASPQFATNDYGSTPAATNSGFARGPGGALSQADAGIPLQLQDATMRAQFNQTGSSSYHLGLNPTVHPPITIVVPGNQGTLLQSGRGVIFASVNVHWWATRIQSLDTSLGYVDPTHLPLYLTNKILLHIGLDPTNCCIIGFHGAGPVPSGNDTAYGPGHAGHLRPPERRRQLGAAGHSRHQPRGSRVGRRPVHQQLRRAVADAHGAAVWLHKYPRDRRPRRRHRLREGNEHLRPSWQPERNAERRRVLPPGGRGLSTVVHEDRAQHRVRTDAEPFDERRALHTDGRLESVPGLPPAGNGLLNPFSQIRSLYLGPG